MVAKGAERSVDVGARVLVGGRAVNERKRARLWRVWTLAGATAVIVGTLIVGLALQRRNGPTAPEDDLAAAQKLAEWRAPPDALLLTPGREIFKTTPKLGKSELKVPAKTHEEE